MTFRELRNRVAAGLSSYLRLPVSLSNQVDPEQPYPFVIYSVTTPYTPDSGLGEYYNQEQEDGSTIELRIEQPTASFSFTACSGNRKTEQGYVLGDDEAMEVAEKAMAWFLHAGYDYISSSGITVVDVSNVQERSTLQVDEAARRYGFDVIIRYVRKDERIINTIQDVNILEKGDNK